MNIIKMKQNERAIMTLREWINLPRCPVQRDEEKRDLGHLDTVNKTHLDVYSAIVTTEFKNPNNGTTYEVGYECKINGHGRAYKWDKGLSDTQPSHVTATIYTVNSWQELEDMYDFADSDKSVEKRSEKILARLRAKDVHLSDPKLSNGQPLGFAASLVDPEKNPKTGGLSTAQINEAVNLLHPQYKVMQDYVCDGNTELLRKNTTSQSFDFNSVLITACLVALKSFKVTPKLLDSDDKDYPMYINAWKLVDLIREINTGNMDQKSSPWSADTHIIKEFNGTGNVLKNYHGQSPYPALNLSSYVPCTSFVLYWMLQHMKGVKHDNLPKKTSRHDWSKMASNFPEIVKEKFAPLYHDTNIIDMITKNTEKVA